jgi:hypothetical protein
MGHRARRLRLVLVPLAVAALGIVLAIVGDDAVEAIGWGLIGVAVVLVLSLVFFAVGRSEDRARARHPHG